MFLPVPFEKDWSAVADGQEVQILKADSGFMAIKLGKGSHSFELKYHYPGAAIGCIFSALSIMVLGIIFPPQKKFKKVIYDEAIEEDILSGQSILQNEGSVT